MLKLSVVIATHNASHVIELCLQTLQAYTVEQEVEIIVADSSTDGTDELIRRDFPAVKLLHFTQPLTLPFLRGEAIAVAKGEIVAILDPFSVIDSQWYEEVIKSHQDSQKLAIGGAVELYQSDDNTLVNWANYINEYGGFILPLEAGVVNILPGSNITYKRQALGNVDNLRSKGFWKAFANWELEASNHCLYLNPSMLVHLNKPITFLQFFISRFHHGRCYAAMRDEGKQGSVRILRALTTPLLPALFLYRLGSGYWPKRRKRKEFIRSLPLLVLLDMSWAWGELIGYLFGSGKSCRQLFY